METYVITGGAGFIGSHIAERLVKEGHRVRIIDNFSRGKAENIQKIMNDIELYKGDINDTDLLKRVFRGADYVIHHAACVSAPQSFECPEHYIQTNITGTLQVLKAALEAGVKRVVYAASSSAYGDNPNLPLREDEVPQPLSPYAVTKLSGEQLCKVFWYNFKLETIALRYFNVFGPRQDPNDFYSAVIPKFISAALAGEKITVFGDGEQTRDFVYIDNVVEANLLACHVGIDAVGEVFNIASGCQVRIKDLIYELQEVTGRQIEVEHKPPRPGDIKHSLADISKAARMLNYVPKVSWKEGLLLTVEWYRNLL
ncbi:MAG: UDP-N-acetylglucosamine/UDP-N-acetylgalactosamine 4-epimerase [Thermosediminibacterales bacterium]|nr:UDP-N-acetylglucosamine/UDP-N-acetylgalactosamine 4-epimerase [Thermosediminibacterales bacterium]MDN5294205.1 UDP-N-acetylglucosamine/UDP-N-acetylgalactosamine 4-epimerase [Eubacteriales bacterium]